MDRRHFIQAGAAVPLVAAGSATSGESQPDYFAIVRAVITSLRVKDLDGMMSHIDDDIVWHSHVGSPTYVGKAAMRDFAVRLTTQMSDIKWRIFDCAQHDNRLYVEGVDDFVTTDGRRVVIPYAGVLVFKGNKISEWRDYFDRALFDRLKAGEPLPDYLVALTTREALF